MALSNSQYDQLMRTYELRQLDNEHRLRRHYENAYALIPELKEVDEHVSSLSIAQAKNLLEGDDSALGQLRERLSLLFARKKELLLAGGLPEDYLERQYACADCRDTGYIGGRKCHCLQSRQTLFAGPHYWKQCKDDAVVILSAYLSSPKTLP